MNADDIDRDSTDQPDARHYAEAADDAAAADEATAPDNDIELDDPAFQAVLFYIESFAAKVAKQINAKHGPSAPETPHEPSEAEMEATDEILTAEPGTDAYDEIHGIPYYELE